MWIKLSLTCIWSIPALDTPAWIYKTIDQIVQTPISPSSNDADLFSSSTGGDTTCQLCLRGLTALPGSISLVWFYLSAHTMEKNQQPVYANHKGGGCEREMDMKRDGRRVELPGEASTSIPRWELAGVFASRCGKLWKLSLQPPKGPQRFVTWISHIVFLLHCEQNLLLGGGREYQTCCFPVQHV